jgi:DNA-binding XRE family transcriptional regulator
MNKIKKLRTEKSLTQEELARVSDIKLSTLQKLERVDANLGKMQLRTAVKLAKGLEIKIEDLI